MGLLRATKKAHLLIQYFLQDHLGSLVAVLGADGNIIAGSEQRYLPFGQVRTSRGPITQTDFGYTGQRDLDGTGLMDYKARFYDSSPGRFIQPDTIVSNPVNPQTWNRYSYVSNDPVNRTVPTGHRDASGQCGLNGIDCEDHTTSPITNNDDDGFQTPPYSDYPGSSGDDDNGSSGDPSGMVNPFNWEFSNPWSWTIYKTTGCDFIGGWNVTTTPMFTWNTGSPFTTNPGTESHTYTHQFVPFGTRFALGQDGFVYGDRTAFEYEYNGVKVFSGVNIPAKSLLKPWEASANFDMGISVGTINLNLRTKATFSARPDSWSGVAMVIPLVFTVAEFGPIGLAPIFGGLASRFLH